MPPAPFRVNLLVASLLAIHTALLWDCARKDFATFDEIGNLAAGIYYLKTGDFGLYRVNPPLTKVLAALPTLARDFDATPLKHKDVPGSRPEWDIGARFASANARSYHDLLVLARLAGIGWSVLAGWVIYRWARELYGNAAGCLALTLWCFEPTVLGHAHLVTQDVPAAAAAVVASYVFWRYLQGPSWRRALLAGFLLGVALLTKLTLVVLLGVWPVLAVVYYLVKRSRGAELPPFRTLTGQATALFGCGLLVVNLGYEFKETGRPLGNFAFVSRSLTGIPAKADNLKKAEVGNRFADTWLGRLPVPVPADYLLGIDVQRRDFEIYSESRYAYLRGQWQQGGWWYYYLYALAVKVPLGFLGLGLLGLACTLLVRINRARWLDELALTLPIVVILTLVSSQTGLNNHLRYVLPIFPFVIISTSKLASFLRREHWKMGTVVAALLLVGVGSTLSVHPHHLAYFNEAAGGPENGHDHILGSNIDWGQDLGRLRCWLDEHPEAQPLGLAYFNHIDPRVIGVGHYVPPLGPTGKPPEDAEAGRALGPHPGYYAVSVRLLRGSKASVPDGRGGWQSVPLHGYEYFHRFRPIAKAGYSIFIYRITPEEANAVRAELGLPPLPENSLAEAAGPP